MIGAVSLNPYVSSYQYNGSNARAGASAHSMQVPSGQSGTALSGSRAVSVRRSGGMSSLTGTQRSSGISSLTGTQSSGSASSLTGTQRSGSAPSLSGTQSSGSVSSLSGVRRSGGVSSLIGARSIAAAGQASGVAGISAGRGADPESPIEPVDAVSALQRGNAGSTNYMIPFLRKGMDPAELAVRMRIQSGETGTAGGSRGAGREEGNFDLPDSLRGAEGEAAESGLPGSSQGTDQEAVQFSLPGASRRAAQEAVQFDLPGSSQAGEETVQFDLPGGSRAAGEEAVQFNLPGGSRAAEETVQIDLPGMPAEEDGQLGLPGTQTGKAAEAGLPGDASATETQGADDKKADMPEIAGLKSESPQETAQEAECQTCKKRKYQDGSDDPGVSFKTPTHIGPEQSASAVMGHEMEHVVRERAKAQSEGRRVISQSVTMQTGICPECGRVYTAGGVTRTTTAAEYKPEENPEERWFCAPAV